MKKLSIIAFLACILLNTACENDNTLNDTRVPDITAPLVSLGVTVNKYSATFAIDVEDGNPAIREYGVLVSTEAQPTVNNSTVLVATADEMSATLVGNFLPSTTYYACAYALTANQMATSEVKQFVTASHQLSSFLGTKTLTGLNLYEETETSISISIVADEEDESESIAYLTGLSSDAGVQLALGNVKMIFDIEAGTVTIPEGQEIAEAKYGNYLYVAMDEKGTPMMGDIVGTIEGNTISFNSLGAFIIAGGNAGLPHWAYLGITIQ